MNGPASQESTEAGEWVDDVIDERRLGQALDSFPEVTASVWLSNMIWGGVQIEEGHIDRLGGISDVRQKAPCAVVNDVESPQGRSILCALTESPSEIDAERNDRLASMSSASAPSWVSRLARSCCGTERASPQAGLAL